MTFEQIIWLTCGTLIPSMLITWLAGFVMRRKAAAWRLVDQPGERKVHHAPTPLGGGLAIWCGVMAAFSLGQLALWSLSSAPVAEVLSHTTLGQFIAPHLPGLRGTSGHLWFLLGAATVLMVVGLVDDLCQIRWPIRLGIQFLVAAVCIYLHPTWRLTAFVDLPVLTGLVSVFWIVGLVNSFNMLDNMDGLSAGVAAIAATMLAAVLLVMPSPEGGGPQLFVSGFLLVLAGALLGFLWHNRPVARLFMGDAGSYFIGFCIAVAALLASFASFTGEPEESRHTILAPLCVMAVPLYDTVTVLWIRLREGRSPFSADKNHFSHRLVALGFTKEQAVLTIYLTTVTCGLAALLLHQVRTLGACLILLLVGCVLALISILESTARRKIEEG